VRVAILGATGAVGRTMLRVLEDVPAVDEIVPLASARSAGSVVDWRGREWRVETPSPGIFARCPLSLFSAGATLSREWAPRAAAAGSVVVDNSSAWRMDPDVPLVVPEVNPDRAAARPKGIIANPNCSTIQLVVPLEALRRAAGLTRVTVATYQSVSGAGQKGLDAYHAELHGGSSATSPFPAPIAGNVIPRIGGMRPDGWTEEEVKMRNETRKILDLPALPVTATCVRVPVEVGHCVATVAELERPLPVADAARALAAMPGISLVGGGPDDLDPLPTHLAGRDEVQVGRVRADPDREDVLHLWIVADNLRKGAATNAVQIAELVLRE
jgi:aspartate-semialdehyde dehydrogenase